MSGVMVASRMQSTSSGATPALSRHIRAASVDMNAVALSGSRRMRRSRMPVRDRIHSSFVSTSASRSAFVSRSGGR